MVRVLSQVKTFLLQGWPSTVEEEELRHYAKRKTELSLQEGCIFWGARVIVPPPGRSQIIEEIHETHPGVSRMKNLARSYVWWPKRDQDLESKVKSCTQCQINQNMPQPAPLHPWEWSDRPWSRLHLDFAGTFMGQMFLIMVDAHSKWIEAHIMLPQPSTSSGQCLQSTGCLTQWSRIMVHRSPVSYSVSLCNKMAFTTYGQLLFTQPRMVWLSGPCRQ